MKDEAKLNAALALWLAEQVFPMSETARLILLAALAALVGRMVWQWMRPRWVRYPATVAAIALLALIALPR